MESRMKVARHLEPWRDLTGKVAMVTGASSGIGREISLDLAKAGCRVIAAARRVDRLKSLCDEINGVGSGESSSGTPLRAVAIELDVSADGPAIEAAVQRAWDAFGRIDALINNAGVRGRVHTPLDLTEEEWNDLTKTNLTGTWLVSKYVSLHMCNAKLGGSIVNISSISGLNRGQLPGGLAYTTSKTAVNALTRVPLSLLFLSPHFPLLNMLHAVFFFFFFFFLEEPHINLFVNKKFIVQKKRIKNKN
nr:3-oxoacyl-[acyl-carrier-protein] reductase FabG-like [Ipomoea batatas]